MLFLCNQALAGKAKREMADTSKFEMSENAHIQPNNSRKGKKKKARSNKKKVHKPIVEVGAKKNRALITEIHVLNKRLRATKNNEELSREEKTARINELEEKVTKLGGIDAYQTASKHGESRYGNFNSAKWVVKQLKAVGANTNASPIKLLDVGALKYNYSKQRKWIDCTAIDLNPQTSEVSKSDFLQMKSSQNFDVVVLSLVINYEGDGVKRGEMLKKCVQLVKTSGYVFIVLPRPCLSNSRYLTQELFVSMMDSLGFALLVRHCTRKLSFTMFQKTDTGLEKSFPKRLLRAGDKRNNFCIVLRNESQENPHFVD